MLTRRFASRSRVGSAQSTAPLSGATRSNVLELDPTKASAAHLARRATLSPSARRIDELASRSWGDAVESLLDGPEPTGSAPQSEDWGDAVTWWIDRMLDDDNGLGERMAWFWHTHLTTNVYKTENALIAPQIDLLRTNALGNYRTMLQAYVVDGALLHYLDGHYSMASNPNENLGRELMELFTIGRGNYTQDDVRAASRALAGWVVDDDTNVVRFERSHAFLAPMIFLGEQADWDTASIVDRLCDHPATAARVSAKVWRHLVGTHLDEAGAAALGEWWQAEDLEIKPLVARILRSEEFADARWTRPRTAFEWSLATLTALELPTPENVWQFADLGQAPYLPPNVAGWPDDDRWLSGGSMLNRASTLWQIGEGSAADTALAVDEILDRCGLHDVTQATSDALRAAGSREGLDDLGIARLRWRLALSSPEFNLA